MTAVYVREFSAEFLKTMDDERAASWKYLLPIDEKSRVLLVCDKLDSTAVALARSVRQVSVAGLGPDDKTALIEWAKVKGVDNIDITDSEGGKLPFKDACFDLIVLSAGESLPQPLPKKNELLEYLRTLRLNGTVFYIGGGASGTRGSQVKVARFFKGYGFRVKDLFCFLPRVKGYKLCIPLLPPSVFRSGLQMHNTLMLSSRLKKYAVGMLSSFGLLRFVLPGYALVFVKEGQGSGRGKTSRYLAYIFKALKRDDLSVILHSASPGVGAKAILKVVEKDGNPLAYVKISDNSYRGAFIETENKSLRYLSKISFKSAAFPEVISFEKKKGHYILILQPSEDEFTGKTDNLDKLVLNFTVELFTSTSKLKNIYDTRFWEELLSNSEKLIAEPFGRPYGWLREVAVGAAERIDDKELPFGVAHRDLVGWNIKTLADGRLYVMDWEWSREEFIPFADLFHYILLTQWATNEKSVTEILTDNFFSASSKSKGLLERYCQALGLPVQLGYYFLILYLVEWTTFHLLQIGSIWKWASETLLFLEKVRSTEQFGEDKWLRG